MEPCVVTRPNGKVYRAKRLPQLNSYLNTWGDEYPLVTRTHDVDLALRMVNPDPDHDGEWYRCQARLVWVRLVPFSMGSGYDSEWHADPVRGYPAVEFTDCPDRGCGVHGRTL